MGDPNRPYAPFVRAQPLAGRALRHAALVVLLRSAGSLSPSDVLTRLGQAGYTVHGANPAKVIADALGHEVSLGRVRRPRWGHYAIGYLPKVTASRVRRRWNDATDH